MIEIDKITDNEKQKHINFVLRYCFGFHFYFYLVILVEDISGLLMEEESHQIHASNQIFKFRKGISSCFKKSTVK